MSNQESFSTLWKTWEYNAQIYPDKDAIIHWNAGKDPIKITFSQLLFKANLYSIALKRIGIKKREVCAIIMQHNEELYPLYLGIVGIGALPAILAYPNPRLHPDKFRQGIEGMSQRSGLDWIFTEHSIEQKILPLIDDKKTTIKGIHFPLSWELNDDAGELNNIETIRNDISSNDPVLLQHSSGTTGLQKPVVLSHRAILDHVKKYGGSLELSKEDKIVSWLPLYHDMGLIAAFHLPLAFGITTVQIDPFEWVLAPQLLLDVISEEKGTLTWLPNFAYNVFADKIRDEWLQNVNLETLRMIINCSEPVRHYSHEKFYHRYSNFGLKDSVLSTCYAMAETTFAVTQNAPGKPINEFMADREWLAKGIVKKAENIDNGRICVSSGSVIDGCIIKIVDNERKEIPNGNVGEIAIKSISMFDGYRNYPEKTEEVLSDGWYYSGDYGFNIGNDYYIIGRKKDIIIVAGKNIYPEDIEDLVSKVPGVIPGRVIAFGEDDEKTGTELISVLAESALEEINQKKHLVEEIKKVGMSLDISISNIYIVPPKWLIKSSAGKPSRKANRERILTEKLEAKK